MGALQTLHRALAREQRTPPDARCRLCGWSEPLALVAGQHPTRCYACDNRLGGGDGFERHHIAGVWNRPFLIQTVDANLHRILSDWQYDWPVDVRTNPGRSET